MSDLETVAYRHGDVALTGLLAQPASAPRAAILLFPTIANINAPMERRARMLADLGYVVLIADFYGETPQDMDEARPLASALRAQMPHSTAHGWRLRQMLCVRTLRRRDWPSRR